MSGQKKHDAVFGAVLIAVAIFLFWLLNRKGLIHESVISRLLPDLITERGSVSPDPDTGLPRFDSRVPQTIPPGWPEMRQQPLGSLSELFTNNPRDPLAATCPAGYVLFKNEADKSWWCLPR